MDEAFRAKLRSKLADYRAWSSGRAFADCRLVHYCGVDLVGAQAVPMAEVERVVSELTRSPTGAGAVRERAVPLPVGRSKLADARHVTNEKKARRRLALRHAWADEKTTATPS